VYLDGQETSFRVACRPDCAPKRAHDKTAKETLESEDITAPVRKGLHKSSRYSSAYGHNVATLLNPRGVTTVSHKYNLTVARHATVVVAVPSTVHHPTNYKMKIYYLI
jgi:hypothetical protein